MMGETGCGKTSLIRKLSELLNNGSKKKMKILNIHAGITDRDIIKFLKKKVIKEAEEIEKQNQIEKKKFEKRQQVFIPKKLWVFLDEINTCKSMGLISELMCKHTYQGKSLPPNIVFIAACNPYRQGSKTFMEKAGLKVNQAYKELKNLNINEINKLKKSSNNTLVYTVNPLPHSLLNYVFNFGKLEAEDEVKYIEKIIYDPILKIYNKYKKKDANKKNEVIMDDKEKKKEEDIDFVNLHNLAKDLINTSQNFIRDRNDKSSVFLREIRRFNIFYEFFFDYLKKKKEIDFDLIENKQLNNEDNEFYQNLDEYDLQVYSVILAVFVCYYLRITDNKTRNELENELNKILNKFDKSLKEFTYVPKKEELYIVNNIELGKGIAKNRALLDNIFSLFIAINNKVPIFIVGKPGCSKSLSTQLINKSMKGSSSRNNFFKGYPRIILNSYQGSMGSTSKGVKKVFKKARNAMKRVSKENKNKIISMIFFDEMGLAEHSPNNPLKVIHSELEYDLNEGYKKVAFVGISNWILDASKMNRGMYLSIPDPDKEDIKMTSITIGQSYDEELTEENKALYENLGIAYYEYKNYLKKDHSQDGKDEFHGNRDFYHLIKNFARNSVEGKKQIDKHIIDIMSVNSIERNFGGLQFNDINSTTSIGKFKNIFSKTNVNVKTGNKYDVLERIKNNINDFESRYLLIISKSSVSMSLLESILSDSKKEYSYYIGSQFKNDLKSEEYSLKILNKIQLNMEQGKLLILKNLESVYPALYDLFNQNFTEVSKKKYARIAIGSSTNAFSLVNDNFRCIVNVDVNQIDSEEPPFLNRFEKHIVSYENLLPELYKEESIRIHGILNELIEYDKNQFKAFNYSLKKIFISSDLEDIQEIVYNAYKKGIKFQDVINEVIKKISLILPQDIILCQELNGFNQKYEDISKLILEEYKKGEHTNLRNFIENMKNTKNVVYTFSNILDYIEGLDKLDTKNLGEISKESIMILKISDYKTENEFEKLIDQFLLDIKKKICLIKFKPNEGNFMNYIKFFIKNKEKESFIETKNKQTKKAFIFIVHLSRINNSDLENENKKTRKQQNIINKKKLNETISLLSEYYQIFIYNLNGSNEKSLDKISEYENENKLYEKLLDIKNELNVNIYKCLSFMKYNIASSLGELNEKTYVIKLIKFINNNQKLQNDINNCLKKQLNNEGKVIKKVFQSEFSVNSYDIDMISVIIRYLSESYTTNLSILYYKAEQDQFFSTLLSINELNKKELKNEIKEEKEEDKIEEPNNEISTKIIEKTREIYLSRLCIINNEAEDKEEDGKEKKKKNGIIEKPGMNEINIILGLKLPGIKPIISRLIKKFKNQISRFYKKNENLLRGFYREEMVESKKETYKKQLKAYNDSMFVELDKNELLLKITKDEYEKNELFDLLLEDFYTLFIDQNLNKKKAIIEGKNIVNGIKDIDNKIDCNSIKKFLKLIIKKRMESNEIFKESDSIKIAANSINWIESYDLDISNILEMF